MDRYARMLGVACVVSAFGCGGESKYTASAGSGGSGSGGSAGAASGGAAGAGASSGGLGGGAGGTNAGAGGASAGAGHGGAGVLNGGSAGTLGEAGVAGAAGAAPVAALSGKWGMFWFEDPVAVSIEQSGELLAGTGCCAGLEGGTDFLQCCGALSGSVSGNQVAFEFEFGGPGEPRVYGTQVTLSEDGQRMGGTFILDRSGVGFDAAWVPLLGAHLGGPSDELRQALLPLDRSYELKLVSASAGRFEPLAVYRVVVSANGFVGGDFGVFYFGEMAWDATSATLRVGPVAATDPRFATQLELQTQGQPETLIVTYPDEPPYVFSVADTE